MLGGSEDFINKPGGVRVRGFELGDVSHADDGVEGCADFMAHVGEEGALGLGGGEGIFPE